MVLALQEVLQHEAVHHGAEHAHVVGAAALDATLLQLGTAEEVAAADDDGDLRARRDDLGDLPADGVDHRGVDTDGPAAEHLAAELEQHAAEAGAGVFPGGVHAIRPGRPRTGRSP